MGKVDGREGMRAFRVGKSASTTPGPWTTITARQENSADYAQRQSFNVECTHGR